MWVVLEAAPGASMTAGLKPGIGREEFGRALKDGSLDNILNEFPVKAGDVIHVPAGRVHAIGKGCLVAEIQQNSDTTWRVFDYHRLENGKPRELHLSQAMDCIRFDASMASMPSLQQPAEPEGAQQLLVESTHFKVSRLALQGRFAPPPGERVFHLVSCLEGRLLVGSGSESLEIGRGCTVLMPASLHWSLQALQEGTLALWSRP
jgi:mannose-6-phosphate isomerase